MYDDMIPLLYHDDGNIPNRIRNLNFVEWIIMILKRKHMEMSHEF